MQQYSTVKLPFSELDPGTEAAYHIYPIVVNDRDQVVQQLKGFNIGTSIHYTPVHLFSYFKDKFNWNIGDFPVAEHFGKSTLSLPLFTQLTDKQAASIISCLTYILDQG